MDKKSLMLRVRITPEQKEKYKETAAKYNITMSELVRIALEKWMEERQ